MTVSTKVTGKLVDNWKDSWKWLSVQLSVVVAAIMTLITTYPEEFAHFIEGLPSWAKPVVIGIVTIAPVILRLLK